MKTDSTFTEKFHNNKIYSCYLVFISSISFSNRLSVAIVLLEHHLTTLSYSNHHITVTGVENLPTVASNQCWLSENYSVAHECQPCTGTLHTFLIYSQISF